MTETADVIIIGAGIMGASTAYHLARRRFGRVVVLERDTVASGSTALASGGIRHQYGNRVGIELTRQSIVTFERFEEEFGVDPQFRQHGYLLLVATEAELAMARRNVALQQSLDVDVRLLRFHARSHRRPAHGRADRRWPGEHRRHLAPSPRPVRARRERGGTADLRLKFRARGGAR